MGFMKKDNHIDPELFELFLTRACGSNTPSGSSKPAQIDQPDIEAVLRTQPS